MKKWRDLTDDEVDEELEQIALERQILEDAMMPSFGTDSTFGGQQDNAELSKAQPEDESQAEEANDAGADETQGEQDEGSQSVNQSEVI